MGYPTNPAGPVSQPGTVLRSKSYVSSVSGTDLGVSEVNLPEGTQQLFKLGERKIAYISKGGSYYLSEMDDSGEFGLLSLVQNGRDFMLSSAALSGGVIHTLGNLICESDESCQFEPECRNHSDKECRH